MRLPRHTGWCTLVLLSWLPLPAAPAALKPRPAKILIVVAHPDDEIAVAATTYKVTQELGGTVDQAVITNGEGGFNYATLSERIYGIALTREPLGRRHLPRIRKGELARSGRIMGVRRHYFLGQRDGSYTEDPDIPLQREWDTGLVSARLQRILERERDGFVFALLPIAATHGHHKAATVLALEAVARLPPSRRPVVLGAMLEHKSKPNLWTYAPLPGHPGTRLQEGSPIFVVDLTVPFGYRQALNYQVLSNWVIAEHKSQGLLQMFVMRNYELETFRLFHSEAPGAVARAAGLFQSLNPPAPGTPGSHHGPRAQGPEANPKAETTGNAR